MRKFVQPTIKNRIGLNKPKHQIACPNCDGSKQDPETKQACDDCGGTGIVTIAPVVQIPAFLNKEGK